MHMNLHINSHVVLRWDQRWTGKVKLLGSPKLDRPLSEGDRRSAETLSSIEPTFQMQPRVRPTYEKYEDLIMENLNKHLNDVTYDENECLKLSKNISDDLLREIKTSSWPERYKCIVNVTLGQKVGQGVRVSSLCAWDSSSDNYVTCSYQNATLFCVVAVYGIYQE